MDIKLKEEYDLMELFEKLFLARMEENYVEIRSLILQRMENKFDFCPKSSNFSEIVIEYLSGGWTSADYLEARYNFTKEQAQQVAEELERFEHFTE